MDENNVLSERTEFIAVLDEMEDTVKNSSFDAEEKSAILIMKAYKLEKIWGKYVDAIFKLVK